MSETEDRLVRLESVSAEQERTIGELSDVIADQWRTIERLEKTCGHLRDMLEHLQDRIENPGQEPPPPHY